MKALEQILADITSGALLNESCFSESQLDGILDQRDEDPFDNAWSDAYEAIANVWDDRAEQASLVEDIRKTVFMRVSQLTSQHEIAAYVSDDFDLIAKNIALNAQNGFIEQLYMTYQSARVPC